MSENTYIPFLTYKKCEPDYNTSFDIKKHCFRTLPLHCFRRKKQSLIGEVDLPTDHVASCKECVKKFNINARKKMTLEQHLTRLYKSCLFRERARHVAVQASTNVTTKDTESSTILRDSNNEIHVKFEVKNELTFEEVRSKWNEQCGKCAFCNVPLVFWSDIDNEKCLAVIDRVDASDDRAGYHNNFQFLCYDCNFSKSSFDCYAKLKKENYTLMNRITFLENQLQSECKEGNKQVEWYKYSLATMQEKYQNAVQQTMYLAYLRQLERERTKRYKEWIKDKKAENTQLDEKVNLFLIDCNKHTIDTLAPVAKIELSDSQKSFLQVL